MYHLASFHHTGTAFYPLSSRELLLCVRIQGAAVSLILLLHDLKVLSLSALGRRLLGRKRILGSDSACVVPCIDVLAEAAAVGLLAAKRIYLLIGVVPYVGLLRRCLPADSHAQV